MALQLDLNRTPIEDNYKDISGTTLELEFRFTDSHKKFEAIIPAIKAIPAPINSLRIMGGSMNNWHNFTLHYPISAIPPHITTLNVRGNGLLKDNKWVEHIPATVTSLDLSQNYENMYNKQDRLELNDFKQLCSNFPQTIKTLTFSEDNIPEELTAEQLKNLLTGVKTLIVVDADGKPLTDHKCAFTRDQAPAPHVPATKPDPKVEKPKAAAAHPEITDEDYDTPKQAAISPMFFMQVIQYASLAVAAIGVCMLALSPFVIAGAAVAAIGAVGFFAAKMATPSEPNDRNGLYQQP